MQANGGDIDGRLAGTGEQGMDCFRTWGRLQRSQPAVPSGHVSAEKVTTTAPACKPTCDCARTSINWPCHVIHLEVLLPSVNQMKHE
ncbi:hypothetical protein GGI22_008086, partial [Coemansia erecta]